MKGRTANQIVSQIKATQASAENAASRRLAKMKRKMGIPEPVPQPLDFPHWAMAGIERVERMGAVCSKIPATETDEMRVRIDWGTHEIVRTVSDMENEYEKEYLPRFRQRAKAATPAC